MILANSEYDKIMESLLNDYSVDLGEVGNNLWMDEESIMKLHEDGHVIGMHSHTHPTRITRLKENQQKDKYNFNFEAIKKITHKSPASISHPCNDYSDRLLGLLKEMSIKYI